MSELNTQEKYWELMQKVENLHPDLEKFKDTVANMPSIRHPLLYSIPHFDQMNAYVNYRYAFLKEQLQKALESNDIFRIVHMYERPYRLNAFIEHVKNDCSPKNYWKMVGELYTDCENIYQNVDEWENVLFNESPKLNLRAFMQAENYKLYKALPDQLTIYRGTKDDYWQGFSWTLDKEKAKWFALRWKMAEEHGFVTEAQVNKSFILGHFAGRGESEIVTHYEYVNVINTVKVVAE